MPRVKFDGPYAVDLALPENPRTRVEPGQEITVSQSIADELIARDEWSAVPKSTAKPAGAKSEKQEG